MQKIVAIGTLIVALSACVPAKKYNELVERERICSQELEGYKSSALTNEGKAKELEARYEQLKKDVSQLKKDTLQMGTDYRFLQAQYDLVVADRKSTRLNSSHS